jgi:hypothetical protein
MLSDGIRAMLKYLRIAVTVLSLTACVLLIALWVRSYYGGDYLYWNFAYHRSVLVGSTHGRLVIYTDAFRILILSLSIPYCPNTRLQVQVGR